MSIDKNSTGLPGINIHKRSTKVNLWMIAAVLVFLALMTVAAMRISRSSPAATEPAPPVVVVKE